MSLSKLRRPLENEQIIQVEPDPGDAYIAEWHRHLNLFSGRTLTDTALETEQRGRAGRLAMLGRAIHAGVLSGLEATLLLDVGDNGSIQIDAGRGLTADGEDVVVHRPAVVALDDLPIDGSGLQLEAVEGSRLPTLGELRGDAGRPPSLAFLVLRPASAGRIGELDESDPCPRDLESEAFEDQQWVDGVLISLQVWSDDDLPAPARVPDWRNRIANAVFDHERSVGPDAQLPWSRSGLAIGIVAFADDAAGLPLFVDRGSVVRMAVAPPLRASRAVTGGAAVQQARIAQFSEHMAALAQSGVSLDEAVSSFRTLPPIGLLPVDVLDLAGRQAGFFPSRYEIDAIPIPIEQLPLAFRECAPLTPLDTARSEHVELLVPVPQTIYDPDLLATETEDPIFLEKLEEFRADRNQLRSRRDDVRAKYDVLFQALEGELPDPVDDDEVQANEAVVAIEGDPEALFGTAGAGEAGEALTLPELAELEAELTSEGSRLRSEVLYEEDGQTLNRLRDLGLDDFIDFLEDKVKRSDDAIDLGFLRSQAEIYRLRQLVLGTDAASKLAVNPALALIAQGESAVARKRDIADFLERAKRQVSMPTPPTRGSTPGPTPGPPSIDRFTAGASEELAREAIARDSVRPEESFELRGSAARASMTFPGGSAGGRFGGADPRVIGAAGRAGEGVFFEDNVTRGEVDFGGRGGNVRPGARREDVREAEPIVGTVGTFRHVTTAARLAESPAPSSKLAALAAKRDLVFNAGKLGINLEGLEIPGRDANGAVINRVFIDEQGERIDPASVLEDPEPEESDEAAYFSDAVRVIDETVFTLRGIESRTLAYRRAIGRCRAVRVSLQRHLAAAARRRAALDGELAEARHDVSVAESLREEERNRIEEVNTTRRRIVAEHAPYVVFRRPRLSTSVRSLPTRVLDPVAREGVLPACASRDIDAPPELGEMIDTLKEAPVRWFLHVRPFLAELDRVPILRRTIEASKQRAIRLVEPGRRDLSSLLVSAAKADGRASQAGAALERTLFAGRDLVHRYRLHSARYDLGLVEALSWRGVREAAEQIVSLGDMMEAGHGRARARRAAASELDRVSRVSACLYAGFSETPPEARLQWVERLSEFDDPVALRRLARLPGFGTLDRQLRRELQALVDWLYSRVEASDAEAVALIDDLVRVCLLLASHAPISQIVAGRVSEETQVAPGGSFEVAVDPSRIRIGMGVLVYHGETSVLRGVVEDLTANRARTRVVGLQGASFRVEKDARVHFADSRTLDRQLDRRRIELPSGSRQRIR